MDAPVSVPLRRVRRDGDVTGPALLIVGEDRLTLSGDDLRQVEVAFAALDGVALGQSAGGAPTLALHLAGGAVLELEGDARVSPLAAAVERRATRFPELTRALRAMGDRRGAPGAQHDRFFAPLLEARLRAERAGQWEEQVAAFAPAALRRAWTDALGEFAQGRHPQSAPDRRALEAALAESLEAADACLGRLEAASAALLAADDAVRLQRWRAWLVEVGRLFEEADRCWLAALRELGDAPLSEPARPRRRGLLGRLRDRWGRDRRR